MLDFILIILVLVSLAVIASIVLRKFPALASLDINTIKKELENRQKEHLVGLKLKRSFLIWYNRLSGWLKPVVALLNAFFQWLYAKIHEWREKQIAQKEVAPEEVDRQVERLVDDAENLSKQDELEVAEKKLIEAISLDSKNIDAFRALAHLYFDKKEYEEAKQTFEHVLKLNENDEDAYEGLAVIASQEGDYPNAKEDYQALARINNQKSETYYNLALVCEAMKEFHEALANIKKALAIEENNPRYLDLWLKTSIIIKDKVEAFDAYAKLKEVNPENQKLEELRAQIEEL
jgi:tetratricopeptide (TPR) repeat protein